MDVIVSRLGNGRKAISFYKPVWDELRVSCFLVGATGGPALVAWQPGGAEAASTLKYEFAVDNAAHFDVQLPSGYVAGSDLYVHLHWTPGATGETEDEALVGWKVLYAWANINGAFGAMATADLSSACDGVDHKHLVTPSVKITGTGKGMSSMLSCIVTRTLTDAEDTWASTESGSLPLLLSVDFDYQIDAPGSVAQDAKFW